MEGLVSPRVPWLSELMNRRDSPRFILYSYLSTVNRSRVQFLSQRDRPLVRLGVSYDCETDTCQP